MFDSLKKNHLKKERFKLVMPRICPGCCCRAVDTPRFIPGPIWVCPQSCSSILGVSGHIPGRICTPSILYRHPPAYRTGTPFQYRRIQYLRTKEIIFVVKLWDTRKLKTPIAQTPPQCQEGRVHGISSLAQDSTGTFIIASCMDNKIYMYNALQPDKGPLKSFSGHELDSFYIKACFSPDGTHILSGSSDGNAFLWQVDRPEESPVKLNGHLREVTAVDWCPSDFCKITTCSDDYTVRVWNIVNSNFESIHSTPSAIRQRISAYPASISQRLFSSTDSGHLEYPLPDTPACDFLLVSADGDKAITPQRLRSNEASTPQASKISVSRSLSMEGTSVSPNSNILSRVVSPCGKENGTTIERTPESLKSPSSVLNPPSSSKRKTILDYFGTNQ